MIKSFDQFLTEALSLKSSDKGAHFLERADIRLAKLKVIGVQTGKSKTFVKLDEETTSQIEYFFRKTLSALAEPTESVLFRETTIEPTKIGLVLMARPQVILPDGTKATPVFSVYERSDQDKTITREGTNFWIVTIGTDVQTILLHNGDGRNSSQLDTIIDRSIKHLVSSREAELARLSRVSGIDFSLKSEIKSAHQVSTDVARRGLLSLDLSSPEDFRKQTTDKIKEFTERVIADIDTEFRSGDFDVRIEASKQMTVSNRTWFMERNETFGVWGALPVLTSKLVKGITGNEIWLEVGDKWVYWLKNKPDGTVATAAFNAPRPSNQRIIKKGDTVSLAKETGKGAYVINTGLVSEIAIDSTKSNYPYFKTENWISNETISAAQAADIFRRKEQVVENKALSFKDWLAL
jgi:hypothetical protein